MNISSLQLKTGQCLDAPIDNRFLQLKLSFYDLSKTLAGQLGEEIILWQEALFCHENLLYQRTMDGRAASLDRVMKRLCECLAEGRGSIFGASAWAKSEMIYNHKTLQVYQRFLKNEWRPTRNTYISADYANAWDELFSGGQPDAEEIKRKVLELVLAENKKCIGWCTGSDASMALVLTPYKHDPTLFWGEYSVEICNTCLDGQTQFLAESLKTFAEHISNAYKNISARVMLQPQFLSSGPYRHYFSRLFHIDGSHLTNGCEPVEWYGNYYLQGVEWCNILSPLNQRHMPSAELIASEHGHALAHQLSGGGYMVCSSKQILEYDVADALEMKKLLLPALYPGWSSIPLNILFSQSGETINYRMFPRKRWEIVPVFPDEIQIVGNTHLCFYSRNCEMNRQP